MKMNPYDCAGKNYFNQESFDHMCEMLESGKTIMISIQCIGHTRAEMEHAHYVRELTKKYGDRLIEVDGYWCPLYRLSA